MRIRVSKENDILSDRMKNLYGFKSEGIVPRIAFSLSIQTGKLFNLEDDISLSSDGRDFRDDRGLFGTIIGGTSNTIIFKTVLDQHYNKTTYEDEFIKLFKQHLDHGLNLWSEKIEASNISKGEHIDFLLKSVKTGLSLRSNTVKIASGNIQSNSLNEFNSLLTFEIGKTENGETIKIPINDLREFDNRNMAIAGMAGSGKTQLMKDILYQISENTNNELKF